MSPEEEAQAIQARARARILALQMMQEEPQAEEKPTKEGWYEDLGEGLGVSALKTYNGVKDIWGGVTEADRARLADWRADAAESGWGTAGEVVGDIGQVVVPGGVGLKAARGLGAVRNATQGLGAAVKAGTPGVMLATDAAASAGLGALQAPTGDDISRWEGAAEGAAGALGGALAGKVLSKAMRGISVTPAAQQLMDEGIELTPGQASSSRFLRNFEALMAKMPGTATGTNILRDRALGQWNQATNRMVRAPGQSAFDDVGFDAQQKLREGFEDAYRQAWAGAGKPSAADVGSFKKLIGRERKKLNADSQFILKDIADDVDDVYKNFTPEKMRLLDHKIKKAERFGADNGNPYLRDAAKDLHGRFREIVGPNTRQALEPVDSQYRKYLDVRRAAARSGDVSEGSGGAMVGNIYRPDQLGAASRSRVSESGAAQGYGPMQEWAALAQSTIGREDPAALSSVKQALTRATYSPTWLLDIGGRAMLGNNMLQKGAKKVVDSDLAKALRQYTPSAAAMGGAYFQDD